MDNCSLVELAYLMDEVKKASGAKNLIALLPLDIILHIVNYIDLDTVSRVLRVCKSWNKLFLNDHIWHHFCTIYGIPQSAYKISDNYYALAKTFYVKYKNFCACNFKEISFTAHLNAPIRDIVFIQSNYIVTCSQFPEVVIWDVSGKIPFAVSIITCASVSCMEYIPYCRWLILGTFQRDLVVWELSEDYQTNSCIFRYTNLHYNSIMCLCYDEFDNSIVSGGADSALVVSYYNQNTGQWNVKQILSNHTSKVTVLKIKNNLMSSGSSSGVIWLWKRGMLQSRHQSWLAVKSISLNTRIMSFDFYDDFMIAGFGLDAMLFIDSLDDFMRIDNRKSNDRLLYFLGHPIAFICSSRQNELLIAAVGERNFRAFLMVKKGPRCAFKACGNMSFNDECIVKVAKVSREGQVFCLGFSDGSVKILSLGS